MMDDYDVDDESPSIDDELSFPQKNTNGGGTKGGGSGSGSYRRKCCIFLLLGSASMGVLYGLTELYDIPILDQLGGALNYNQRSGEIGNHANNEKSQDALNGNKTHSPGLNEWQQKIQNMKNKMRNENKNKFNFTHGGFHNNGAWAHRVNKTKIGGIPKLHNGNNAGSQGKIDGDTGIGSEQIDSHGSVDKQLPDETTPKPSNTPQPVDESIYDDWLNAPISKSDGVMYEVVGQMEHDPAAFTQGLTYSNGVLYESTGLYGGKSSIRKLDPQTGKALQIVNMDPEYFGEGMAFVNGLLVQITWREKKGFMYASNDLGKAPIEFDYQTTNGEGWGITYDPTNEDFIVSDGTHNLHFWKFTDLGKTQRKVAVMRQDGSPAKKLNELEFWRGRVIANVWFEDVILVINPETGVVEKEYDFKTLWPKAERPVGTDVLNGISVSEDPDVLYITGKKWNRIYRVKLLAASPESMVPEKVEEIEEPDQEAAPGEQATEDSSELPGGSSATTETKNNQGTSESSEPLNDDDKNLSNENDGVQEINTPASPTDPNTSVVATEEEVPGIPVDPNSATSTATPENTTSGQQVNPGNIPQTITEQESSEQTDSSANLNTVTSTATPENTTGSQQVNTNGVPDTATKLVPSQQADGSEIPVDQNSMASTATPENAEKDATQTAAEQQPSEQVHAPGIPVDPNSATSENITSGQQVNPGNIPQTITEQESSEQTDSSEIPANPNTVTSTATPENTAGSQQVNTNGVPDTATKLVPSEQADASEIPVDQNSMVSTATPENAEKDATQTAAEQQPSEQVHAPGIPVDPNSATSTAMPENTAGSQQVNTNSIPGTAVVQEPSEQVDTSDVPVDQNSVTTTTTPENTAGSDQVIANGIPQTKTEKESSGQVDTTSIPVDPNSVTSSVTPENIAGSQQDNTDDVPQTTTEQEPSQQQVDTADIPVDHYSTNSTSTTTPENTIGNQQVIANVASQTVEEQEPSDQVETLNQNSVSTIATPENTSGSQQVDPHNVPQTASEQGLIVNDIASEIPVNKEVEGTIETPTGNVSSEANDSLTQSSQNEEETSGIQTEKELAQAAPTEFNEGKNEVGQTDAIENTFEEVELPVDVETETADAIGDNSLEWNLASISKSDGVNFEVVRQLEHDPKAFTQGLTYANGVLYESTGLYGGQSSIRKLDPQNGKVLEVVNMEAQYFGEGMTYYDGKLIQITWQERVGFVYNADNLEEPPTQFDYDTTNGEGWGITYNSAKNELIVTDGTNFLHFWDPDELGQNKRKVPVVRQNGSDALKLNELEFWRGRVIANVWYEDVILVINPETGVVEKEYDFETLWPSQDRTKDADCLNGISISEDPDVLYVTGKQWDRMFLIRLLA